MVEKDCGASPKRHFTLKAEPGVMGASMTAGVREKPKPKPISEEEAAKVLLLPVATEQVRQVARAVLKAYHKDCQLAARVLASKLVDHPNAMPHIEAVLRREL